jgi:hypothetical protein
VEVKLNLNPSGTTNVKLDLTLSRPALLWLAFGTFSVETVCAREGIARHSFSEESWKLLEIFFPQGHPFMWEPDRF